MRERLNVYYCGQRADVLGCGRGVSPVGADSPIPRDGFVIEATNGCEKPLERGCAAWMRECSEQWGPILDRNGVQLVVAGHVHAHRWNDETGFGWKQVTGGGPEMGYGAGFKPKPSACPTIIEGKVENGQLAVRVYDAWRERLISERRFAPTSA